MLSHVSRRLRVGAVNYLNTKPLIYGLAQSAPEIDLRLDLPSRLADQLARHELDVALIPSVEFFQNPHYSIISDACIGCRGPVLSVKLFFRKPPEQVQTLALDEGSRTSAALCQILLHQRFNVRPQLEVLPIGAAFLASSADAVLLIGDRAMHSPGGRFVEVWDLGDEWCRWAELPFVFAMWIARPELVEDPAQRSAVEAALSQARDAGVQHLQQIALREAPLLGLTQPECLTYLRDNLYFYLGPRELQGLELFYRSAAQLELAPPGVDLGLTDCHTVAGPRHSAERPRAC